MSEYASELRHQTLWAVLFAVILSTGTLPATTEAERMAGRILDASGVRGGVIVHIGCGNGELTAALRANDRYVVHGLDADPEDIAEARRTVAARGLYGLVTIAQLSGTRLPYTDNLVSLVVISHQSSVIGEEIERVLAPRGVLLAPGSLITDHRRVRRSPGEGGSLITEASGLEDWTKLVKPVPDAIDEWTHWLHGPDGNAVARDSRVGPPRRMQWLAEPLWSRHHNLMPSVSAMVSAGGRLFTIVDEAPPAMTGTSPDKWMLVARDAFSGVRLWQKPIDDWGWRAWSWRWEGRFNQPNQIAKRVVAIGDTVYATLGFNAPLTALDAATGEVLKTYEGTRFTDEILYLDGKLILSINHEAQRAAKVSKDPKRGKELFEPLEADPPVAKSVAVVDAATGRMQWKTGRFIGNSTKTAAMERVTHLLLAARGKRIYLLDRDRVVALDLASGAKLWEAPRPKSKRYTSRYHQLMSDMCTLVAADEAVLLCQLEPIQKRIGWRVIKARTRAYSPETGKALWTQPCGNWGHFCVPDLFVTGGLVWLHDSTDMAMLGLDPLTGAEKRRLSTEIAFTNGHHHRCYRNKATDRYLMTSYRGFEFLDWSADTTDLNHWVRGACRLGGMPCNGLLYTTPHPCDCYITGKLNGLIALAGESGEAETPAEVNGLEKGPAYGLSIRHSAIDSRRSAWLTYRHNAGRSGSTPSSVVPAPKPRWSGTFAGGLSAPVVGEGRLLVASIDTHVVHAIDAATGGPLWSYTAEGQVDTPPTLHKGLALFGCRNGWLYALRADDGRLVWRFRAAPEERLVGAFGRLESAWPVHGSVLVQDDKAYVVAGRSSFLDGGIAAWCLDPATGKVLRKDVLADEQSPAVDTGRKPEVHYGLLADLLLGDGEHVYMRHRRLFGETETSKLRWGGRLGATAGMLDSSWFNRTYWMLDGKVHGETLVHDDKSIYAVRSYSNRGHGGFVEAGQAKHVLAAINRASGKDRWTRTISPRICAMALAGRTLLCTGTPDALEPDEPWAAYEGRRGGLLLAFSAVDGKPLAELTFEGGPTLDGIAVADGNVYITTIDGCVHCFAGARGEIRVYE